MSRQDVSDELLTLLGAGHETTASTLGWAFERLRRHPDILAELVKEVDDGGSEFRQATILELQRARTVIDFAGRHVDGAEVRSRRMADSARLHDRGEHRRPARDPDVFPDPERFDPYRFVGTRPPTFAWVPFGGGTRRCIGAAFANTEMDVVLRTVLQHFLIETDEAPDEKVHFRGIAYHAQGRRPSRGAPPQDSCRLDSPVPSLRGGPCAWAQRALRQLPVRPREVAGVAPREALEIVLVLGFGLPEIARRRHLGDDLARPQPRGLDVGDGVQRDALLLVVGVEDRRAVAGADVVALPVLRRRIVDLEEELQQRRGSRSARGRR